MQKIYDIDFSSLSDKEKRIFVSDFSKIAYESFGEQSLVTSWLAHLLIFTRYWNSYLLMYQEQVPQVLMSAMDLLWEYMVAQDVTKVQDVTEAFKQFKQGFSASMLKVTIGDDSELKEYEINQQFYNRYISNWNCYHSVFAINLCTFFEEIVGEESTWIALSDLIYDDIVNGKIGRFDDVHINSNEVYTSHELDLRDIQVYQSDKFCRIIGLIQRDMKNALGYDSMKNLQQKYRSEYFFSPSEIAKIIYGKGVGWIFR